MSKDPKIVQWWFERTHKDPKADKGTVIGSEENGQLHIWPEIRASEYWNWQRKGFKDEDRPKHINFES